MVLGGMVVYAVFVHTYLPTVFRGDKQEEAKAIEDMEKRNRRRRGGYDAMTREDYFRLRDEQEAEEEQLRSKK